MFQQPKIDVPETILVDAGKAAGRIGIDVEKRVGDFCPELPFVPAAVVMTRVVSKPGPYRLCLDLGHKAVAAENPIENRVRFLNAPEAKFIDQKEEHLVIEVPEGQDFEVGDILYGVPWHICPTVALYQEANAIDKNGAVMAKWPVVARNRRLIF